MFDRVAGQCWQVWAAPFASVAALGALAALLHDAAGVMQELHLCRRAHPEVYIRLNAFDSARGFETVRLSFIVQRPAVEARYKLVRAEAAGRSVRYTLERA